MKKVLMCLTSVLFVTSALAALPPPTPNEKPAEEKKIFSGFFIVSEDKSEFELIDVETLNAIYNGKKPPPGTCPLNKVIGVNEEYSTEYFGSPYKMTLSKNVNSLVFTGVRPDATIVMKPLYVGTDVYNGCNFSGRLMVAADEEDFIEILLDRANVVEEE
ncbi:hypothetical protein JW758_03870 [Candidatus Peregrinibacteria bacterium]|nr:hypothetical protein [Candidatus Peregrinibacteria bacterium]